MLSLSDSDPALHSTARSVTTSAITCVHGVGIGADSFAEVAAHLRTAGFEVNVPHRPAHESPSDQLTSLTGQPAFWVGVSGGATLGVLAIATSPERIAGAVLHEPLVGDLTARLRAILAERHAAALAHPDRSAGAVDFVRELVGASTWDRLDPTTRSDVVAHASHVLRDAQELVQLEPDLDALRRSRVPVTITVGERSPTIRHETAQRISDELGWPVASVADSGHLAQLDAPLAFARVVLDAFRDATAGQEGIS